MTLKSLAFLPDTTAGFLTKLIRQALSMDSFRRSPGRRPVNGIDIKVKTGFSIDADVAEKLGQEKNKSALINQLLRKHYSTPESSRRLVYSLQLINQNRSEHQLSVAKVAHVLGLEKAGIFQSYLDGTEEPSFKFLDAYAQTFGVYPDWLKFGDRDPFYSTEDTRLFATDYLKMIEELSPKVIYFLRSNEEEGSSGILLKFSEFRFTYFSKTWPISSHIRRTGQNQVFQFYKLIKTLQTNIMPNYYCQGKILDKDTFWAIFCGRFFPGSATENVENRWWDDFTDIYASEQKAQEYQRCYGKEFVEAQKIARYISEKIKEQEQNTLEQ